MEPVTVRFLGMHLMASLDFKFFWHGYTVTMVCVQLKTLPQCTPLVP